MMLSQRTSLAVLIFASLILELTSTSSFRRQVRRHRGRGGQRRHRLGREKLEDVTTTSTTTSLPPLLVPNVVPGPERYDLTSYGDSDAPSIKYGAPGPDDYTDDGYAGDVPGAVLVVGDDADYNTDVIAAAASDNDNDDIGITSNNEKASELLPPWCNPTDPMGAWLNYQKIQVGSN